ncbi:SOS response-associated peptidase family protein [Burkholderia ambifaria]|uniref:SOS response-associated peptidase family protein n=1 Tax=Burkholderia ambifaria TaxID=152480 RepID=UPI00158E4942|nr:SOS response-associated peptidase family protein [Burkholderia ambifaria]MBR8344249.1 SOS response-associated peptidase family protein [Burkholderia ambifaria]
MCTNYVAPGEDPGLSELKIDSFRDLYRWTPWKPEIYQDYDAPIVASVDGQFKPLIAGFGFWPRALQKANVEKAKEQGRKPPVMRSTMNVRDDNLGKSPLYAPAWRAGRRCLIPADWIYEPCYETGKNVWHRIGLADWRTLTGPDGVEHHTMAMITVSGEGHPIFSRMHRPGDEKRAVVILRPEEWEEWLTTPSVDIARSMLQCYPAAELIAHAKDE